MRHLARPLAASLFFAALLTTAGHAQPFPESERQKADEARKKAEQKGNEDAYEAAQKRTKDIKKPFDPWGNLRASPDGGNK